MSIDLEGGQEGDSLREALAEAQTERDFLHHLVTAIGIHCESEDEMIPLRIEDEGDASVGVAGRWSLYLPDGYEVRRSPPTPSPSSRAFVPVSRAQLAALLEGLDAWPGGMPADVEDAASALSRALDEEGKSA